jgi:hypothetical protein
MSSAIAVYLAEISKALKLGNATEHTHRPAVLIVARPLVLSEVYQQIVVALKETIRLMTEIDEVIPGWAIE